MKKSNLMKKATSVFMSAVAIGTVSSSAVVCHAEDPMGGVNPIIECLKEMPGNLFKEAGNTGGEDALLKLLLGGKVNIPMFVGKTLFRGGKDFYKCLNEKGVTVNDFKDIAGSLWDTTGDFAGGLWDTTKGVGKTVFDWVSSKLVK